jgi:hypothetical protein
MAASDSQSREGGRQGSETVKQERAAVRRFFIYNYLMTASVV